MLKKYVGVKNRIALLADDFEESRISKDDGFASAETIALAVAGILIVGAVYGLFSAQLNNWFTRITASFDIFS